MLWILQAMVNNGKCALRRVLFLLKIAPRRQYVWTFILALKHADVSIRLWRVRKFLISRNFRGCLWESWYFFLFCSFQSIFASIWQDSGIFLIGSVWGTVRGVTCSKGSWVGPESLWIWCTMMGFKLTGGQHDIQRWDRRDSSDSGVWHRLELEWIPNMLEVTL